MKVKLSYLILFVGALISTCSLADNTLKISNIRLPQIPSVSRSAAIYLSFENHSDQDIQLTGVSTPVAHHAMIHQSIEENGIAKMRHQDSLLISANGRLDFSPGGYHIMLMGLNKEKMLKPFTITLEFAKRQPIDVIVKP